MFASFAPSENPEVVVAVISEHDDTGGGGASAAPVAGKILNAYFELKKKRAFVALGASVPNQPASDPAAPKPVKTKLNQPKKRAERPVMNRGAAYE